MNSIVIKNQGEIVSEDLMLIGSSTKRDATNKIGMFGSGWKYALAWFLRNEVDIQIHSGTRIIDIGKKKVQHRMNEVDVITVDGKETSLTTEMGPKWTGWMALREVISNAIDEGNHSIDVVWNPKVEAQPGETIIVIPTNNELSEVMMKYEHYFAFNRKTKYEYPQGKVHVKTEKTPINVYRRGIRCYDDKMSSTLLDFDFYDIQINESRLTESWSITSGARMIMQEPTLHTEVFLACLKSGYQNYLPKLPTKRHEEILKDLHAAGYNFHCDAIIAMLGMMSVKENSLKVPGSWFKHLEAMGLVDNPFSDMNDDYNFMRTDAYDPGGVKYFLDAIRCNVEPIVGKFDSDDIDVKIRGNQAYINETCKGDDLLTAAKIVKQLSIADIATILNK